MVTVILLDAGPLGLVTHPAGGEDASLCKDWFEDELRAGSRIRIPAISDYEVRRELFRSGRQKSPQNLDDLIHQLGYIPILEDTIRTAAELWADSRRKGLPTASEVGLDADCLLAAQARTFLNLNRSHRWVKLTRNERVQGVNIAIATTNAGHLGRYTNVIDIPHKTR